MSTADFGRNRCRGLFDQKPKAAPRLSVSRTGRESVLRFYSCDLFRQFVRSPFCDINLGGSDFTVAMGRVKWSFDVLKRVK